jgi:hypothetical protein
VKTNIAWSIRPLFLSCRLFASINFSFLYRIPQLNPQDIKM